MRGLPNKTSLTASILISGSVKREICLKHTACVVFIMEAVANYCLSNRDRRYSPKAIKILEANLSFSPTSKGPTVYNQGYGLVNAWIHPGHT